MDIKEIQDKLAKFSEERDWDQFHSPKNLAMALTSEVGELNELFQWLTEEQSKNVDNDEIRQEIADIFIYILRLADKLNINIEDAVREKMEINAKELSLFFTAAAKGIQERGKAELGDKTMLDVWMPSAKKIEEAVTHSDDIISVMEITSTESTLAMNATKDMQSKKGRSSKLGERSIGFIDPGAASSQMIIKSFYETIKTLDH